jgi:hypothetical protein
MQEELTMKYPFIFISSLMRSGSTLVQEIFTEIPYSFIFHEPKLHSNLFNVNNKHLSEILKLGINIKSILKPPSLRKFKDEVIPMLEKYIMQIGIKEIINTNWENYIEIFPNTKVILLGRDPRDLYISIYEWKSRARRISQLQPKTMNMLKDQMKNQPLIFKNASTLKVKYEDLCLNKEETILKMKEFVKSPIPKSGKVGGFLSSFSKRKNEYIKHGDEITTNSIGRWRNEEKRLVKQANRFFNDVSDYCDFWGYKK